MTSAVSSQRTWCSCWARTEIAPLGFLSVRIARSFAARLFVSLDLRAEAHLLKLQERTSTPEELELEFAGRAAVSLGAEF